MRTVLVTGGSGYIASFCIAQLLERGDRVRATVRSLKSEGAVRTAVGRLTDPADRLSIHAADLTADAGWREAVEGCDGVLHVASPFFAQTASEDDFVRPARDGTLRVLDAALDAGVQRVVLTSSGLAAMFPAGKAPDILDESCWTDPTGKDVSFYGRSKVIAERAAWERVEKAGRREVLSTVLPGLVCGPVLGRDYSFSLTVVERLLKGAIPGLPRIGFDLVDVRDIADLHVRALDNPAAAGERFVGAADFLWFKDLSTILRRELGPQAAKVPTREVPSPVVRLLAVFDRELRSIVGSLDKRREFTSAKAERLLGWRPRSSQTALVDCARSLIAEGAV